MRTLSRKLCVLGTFVISAAACTSPSIASLNEHANADMDSDSAPTPEISSLSPEQIEAGSDAFTLRITGSHFVGASKVLWAGKPRLTRFSSDTELQAAITAVDVLSPGDFAVIVANPSDQGGTSSAVTATVFGNNPLPEIDDLSPGWVYEGYGDFALTLSGSGFVPTTAVRWNGEDRAATFVSETTLEVAINASDVLVPGLASVDVINPTPGGGASFALTFEIAEGNPLPAVTGLDPSSVVVATGGLTLTVSGQDFIRTSVVHWNGAERQTTFVDETTLLATIDAADLELLGLQSVSVVTPTPGGGESSGFAFAVVEAPPLITALEPAEVLFGTGTVTVSVRGENFSNDSVVLFDGEDRPSTFVSETEMLVELNPDDTAFAGLSNLAVRRTNKAASAADSNLSNQEMFEVVALPRFAYTTDNLNHRLIRYRVDDDRALYFDDFVLFTDGSGPSDILLSPKGDYAFVRQGWRDEIDAFSVDPSTGSFTYLSSVGFNRGTYEMAMDPFGRYIYMGAGLDARMDAYAIDPDTAAMSFSGSWYGEGYPRGLTFDPDGKFAYVVDQFANTVTQLSVAADGALTTRGVVDSGQTPIRMVVEPRGRYAYTANTDDDTISVFAIDQTSGALTPVGSPVAAGDRPIYIRAHPSGRWLYVTNWFDDSLDTFAIDQETGELTLLDSTATHPEPSDVTVDPSGNALFVAYSNFNLVEIYSVDPETGVLSLTGAAPTHYSGPSRVAILNSQDLVHSRARYAYVTNLGSDDISVYQVDPSDGSLTAVETEPAGDEPVAIAVAPSGDSVYAVNKASGTTSSYQVDPDTGALTWLGDAAVGTYSSDVAIDHAGSTVYVVDLLTKLYIFSRDPVTGELTATGTETTVATHNDVAVDVINRNVYTVGFGSLGVFEVAQDTGALSQHDYVSGTVYGASIALDPRGIYIYVTDPNVDTVSTIRIRSAFEGTLDTYPGTIERLSSKPTGENPSDVAVHPTGSFVYVSNADTNDVTIFSVDFATGSLTSLGSTNAGTTPSALAVDAAGAHLYVTNAGSNDITIFAIDADTGSLTPADTTVAAGTSPSAIVLSEERIVE